MLRFFGANSYLLFYFLLLVTVNNLRAVVLSNPENDLFQPVLAAPRVQVATQSKFREEIRESTAIIAFEKEYLEDENIELGVEKVLQKGKAGLKKIVMTITDYNDKEYTKESKEEIIEEPIKEIISRGTKIVPKIIETDYGRLTYKRIFTNFWATSYDSTCPGCDTVTATGIKQGYGVVAVDPKVIPLYSRIYVPGYGIGIAGDVGGAVKGNRIDLGYDSLMGQWSARFVDVYLLIN